MANARLRSVLTVAAAGVLFAAAARGEPLPAATPVKIKADDPQLFVDDFLIDKQDGLKRTLHQPKKDVGGNQPLLELKQEFGGHPATLEANGTIVYDPRIRKWVMFALGYAATLQTQDRVSLFRFTSDDAMNWVKGDDGRPEHIKFDLTDKASGRVSRNHDFFSCFYDTKDAKHPYKGWLFISNWGDTSGGDTLEGLYYVRSHDGKQWERVRQIADGYAMGGDKTFHEISKAGRVLRGPGDGSLFYHDSIDDRLLALLKFYSPTPVPPTTYLRSRAYLFVDRLDEPIDLSKLKRVELVPAAAEKDGDQPYDEYYISTAYRYGPMWLGELKIWHGQGDYPYSAAGCTYMQFLSSRDGLHWTKVPYDNDAGVPRVFIANGPEGGNNGRNDGGYITLFSQGPLRVKGELIYYYGASSWGKNHPPGKRVTGGGIFRARLRPDGFVSVDAGALTTRPLAFEGQELLVNSIGPVTVEVLNEAGDMLGTSQLTGDSLAHQVKFDGKPLGELIAGRPARLRFAVGPEARLHAFRCR